MVCCGLAGSVIEGLVVYQKVSLEARIKSGGMEVTLLSLDILIEALSKRCDRAEGVKER